MSRKTVLTVMALLFVVVPIVGIKASQIMAMIAAGEDFVMPAEAVSLATAEEVSWQTRVKAVGSVRAANGVTVSTDTPGIVRSIAFESGALAKSGQVLVRLDTAVEQAELQSATAAAKLAEINLERAKRLNAKKFATRSAVQDAEAAKLQADARVSQAKAVIERKTIRAPFSGRLGIRQVDLGQFVNAGSAIVELVGMDSVYVDFSLPQRYLADVVPGLKVSVSADAFDSETFNGEIESSNARVDVSSRNVRFRAALKNPDLKLRDGMFVDVEVEIPNEATRVILPNTALLYAPYGNSVYVAEHEKPSGKTGAGASPSSDQAERKLVATQRFVRVGERRGDFVAILEGVAAGDRVVSAGAFKLRNGVAIAEAKSDIDAKLEPTPDNR